MQVFVIYTRRLPSAIFFVASYTSEDISIDIKHVGGTWILNDFKYFTILALF